MGNSRVIFVGAVSVIMGLYTVGLQKSERAVGRIGEVHSYQMQAEEIAQSGIALAINKLGLSTASTPSVSGRSIFGGTVSYTTHKTTESGSPLPSDQIRINATGTFMGHQAVRVAIVRLTASTTGSRKKWNGWQVVRVYTRLNQSEFQNQYTTTY